MEWWTGRARAVRSGPDLPAERRSPDPETPVVAPGGAFTFKANGFEPGLLVSFAINGDSFGRVEPG